jgi:hypothetical protein
MSKISKEEAREMVDEGDKYLRVVEYSLEQLPRTPGRDVAERGVEQVKEGLKQIRKESEGGT